MNMPGMGGLGKLPSLRHLFTNVPVVLITGEPDPSVKNLPSSMPNVTLLPRPFSQRELREHIERLVVDADHMKDGKSIAMIERRT